MSPLPGGSLILFDSIWHVSSRSGAVLVAQTAIRFFTVFYLLHTDTPVQGFLSIHLELHMFCPMAKAERERITGV